MRKIVAAPKINEYKKAYYKKCGKPSALELEKKEIDVAAPEVGGGEADGSEHGSGSTDAKEQNKERCRVWRLRNREHIKTYRRKNRAHIVERERKYRVRNSEHICRRKREYYLRKREEKRERCMKRREDRRMEECKKRMEECKNWFKGKGDDTSKEEPVASFSCKGNGGTQYRPTNPCS